MAVDEKLARPILVGRQEVIQDKAKNLGLRLEAGRDYEVVGFDDRDVCDRAAEDYYQLRRRQGLTRDYAAALMRGNGTLLGAMLVRAGRADGMLCGTSGTYSSHLEYVADAIGVREGVRELAAMHLLMLPQQTVFICDTYINPDPTAASSPTSRCSARRRCAASASSRAWRSCPIPASARPTRPARARCARRCG